MFIEVLKASSLSEVKEYIFYAILLLQSLRIAKGRPEQSEKIFEEIVEPNFCQSFENVEFFAYVVTLSGAYAQHDFPRFAQSKCQKVLDMYSEHAESLDLSVEPSEMDQEILILVTSAHSLLGHQLLNQGQTEEAMLHFSRFEKGNFQFKTLSKYFKVEEAAFLPKWDDNNYVMGEFVMLLSIEERNIIFPNTQLNVIISNPSGETVWQTSFIIHSLEYIRVHSEQVQFTQRGRFVVHLELIDPMTEEAYLHRQTICVEH